MTVVEKLVIIQKFRRKQHKVLVQNEQKLFSGNRKQIVSAHACLKGEITCPGLRGQLPHFYRNLTQNEAFWNCFSDACERITDDVST